MKYSSARAAAATTPAAAAEWNDALERSSSVIYGLDEQLRITRCNAAWDAFASLNRGSHLSRALLTGQCVLPSLPATVREFYASAYRRVFATGTAWVHAYECSSPVLYREYVMTVYPRGGQELLVLNTLVTEREHVREPKPADEGRYTSEHGIVTMCCHCRRTQARADAAWDWVPDYVDSPPARVSHGLCQACSDYFYRDVWLRAVPTV